MKELCVVPITNGVITAYPLGVKLDGEYNIGTPGYPHRAYDFWDHKFFAEYFVPEKMEIGDEIHVWKKGSTSERMKWVVVDFDRDYLILKPLK
jgi:hypothetical protein